MSWVHPVRTITIWGVEYTPAELHRRCADRRESPDLLLELTRFCYPDVDSFSLAENPAVPLVGLIRLMRPPLVCLVLQNPAFRLHMAADPSMIDRLPIRAQRAIVESKVAGPELLRHLASNPSRSGLRVAAASNPGLCRAMMRRFLVDVERVRVQLAYNPSLPPEYLRALFVDATPPVRRAVATRADLSDDMVLDLLRHPDKGVFDSLFANGSLSPKMRETVSNHLLRRYGNANRWRVRNRRRFIFTK